MARWRAYTPILPINVKVNGPNLCTRWTKQYVFFYEETAHQSHSFVSNHALRFLPNTDPMLYPQIRYPNEKW